MLAPGGAEVPLATGAPIAPGAKVVTAPGARADFMFLPGLLVELEGAAALDLEALHFTKDGDDASVWSTRRRTARLRLERGTLHIFVLPLANEKAEYGLEIETGAGIFRAGRGAILQMQAQGAALRVSCVQGEVVAPGGDKIAAGSRQDWPAASAARPGSEPVSESDLSATLIAAARLQKLQLHLRNRVPEWRGPAAQTDL